MGHSDDIPNSRQAIPATRRATSRIAFLRALARHSGAIHELQGWRRTGGDPDPLDEWRKSDQHPFMGGYIRHSSESLLCLAGEDRVQAAKDWGQHWKLDVPWAQAWAVWALVAWDAFRRCTDAACPYDCAKAQLDESVALDRVLGLEAMLAFGEEPLWVSMIAAMQAQGEKPDPSKLEGENELVSLLPIHMRRIVPALPGPHPLVEEKKAFLDRAEQAWDAAVAALEEASISLSAPRKLELHCNWLVRSHVLGRKAIEILEETPDVDPSTLYKAVRGLAEVIGLPLRASDQS